jgi:AcrR family transcriptional regulator
VQVAERALRKDAQANRQKILDAARELFADRGLGTTLNDVAHHAGVGVGTVYRRYRDKEQLIDELFDGRVAELVDLAEQAAVDPDPWRGLTWFLERNLELQAADRGFRQLLHSSSEKLERVARVRARIWPLIGGIVERAHQSGQLRADFQLEDGPMLVLMLNVVIDAARDTQPDLWRRYLAMMIQGLSADPDRPGPLPVPPLPVGQIDAAVEASLGLK